MHAAQSIGTEPLQGPSEWPTSICLVLSLPLASILAPLPGLFFAAPAFCGIFREDTPGPVRSNGTGPPGDSAGESVEVTCSWLSISANEALPFDELRFVSNLFILINYKVYFQNDLIVTFAEGRLVAAYVVRRFHLEPGSWCCCPAAQDAAQPSPRSAQPPWRYITSYADGKQRQARVGVPQSMGRGGAVRGKGLFLSTIREQQRKRRGTQYTHRAPAQRPGRRTGRTVSWLWSWLTHSTSAAAAGNTGTPQRARSKPTRAMPCASYPALNLASRGNGEI